MNAIPCVCWIARKSTARSWYRTRLPSWISSATIAQITFAQLQECLQAAGIPYVVDSRIVRGLDYYTKTVFELITQTPEGNLTVCGGGRL